MGEFFCLDVLLKTTKILLASTDRKNIIKFHWWNLVSFAGQIWLGRRIVMASRFIPAAYQLCKLLLYLCKYLSLL